MSLVTDEPSHEDSAAGLLSQYAKAADRLQDVCLQLQHHVAGSRRSS